MSSSLVVRTCRTVLPVIALLLVPHVTAAQSAGANRLTDAERNAGWHLLFDGTSTDAWRGYMREDLPDGWQAVDGTFTRVARAGDIITKAEYRDFELSFEFLVAEGGNSGIFYRAVEGPEYVYYFAPEYQILDDARHPDGKSPLTSTGADYAVYESPRGVTKPAGEWNTGRIVVKGNHVEHWLNGKKVVDYEIGSDDWAKRVAASKFKQWPGYGKANEGHIGIQDHGSRVSYRNLKIRETGS
jgi:3-keto-disaccharide hydrolase